MFRNRVFEQKSYKAVELLLFSVHVVGDGVLSYVEDELTEALNEPFKYLTAFSWQRAIYDFSACNNETLSVHTNLQHSASIRSPLCRRL